MSTCNSEGNFQLTFYDFFLNDCNCPQMKCFTNAYITLKCILLIPTIIKEKTRQSIFAVCKKKNFNGKDFSAI